MTTLIRIKGVGAYLPTTSPSARLQRLPRGWQGELPDDLVEKWVAAGVAEVVNDDASDQDVSITTPGGAEPKPLSKMTAKELRLYAAAQDPVIEIPSTVKRVAEIRAFVATALSTQNADENQSILPDELPENLGDLSEEQLLELAVNWDVDVPADTDHDQLVALLNAHEPDEDDDDDDDDDTVPIVS